MPGPYELAPFLGTPQPVELVTELLDAHLEGNALHMRCATWQYHPVLHDYYGTQCETCFEPPSAGPPVSVRLDFCTPEIVRVRFFPGDAIPDIQTPMVVGDFSDPPDLTFVEEATAVTVETTALRVVITREPWQISLYDHDQRLIWRTRSVDLDAFRLNPVQWNPPQQRWLFHNRYAYPLGAARQTGQDCVFASFELHHSEHIYGFGESFGPFDKRGTQQRLWLVEGFSNASPGAYKQTPFFMSTGGYGVYVNTANAVAFRVGELDHTALSVTVDDTRLLDYYLIYGPTLKEMLPRYTAITGTPAVPPRWSFGLWMGRISYDTQPQVEAVARDLRERRIPCDVIHIDTNWFARDWACDWRFGADRFPDPAGMLTRLRSQGFRVSLWQWPVLLVDTDVFQEAAAAGLLVRRRNSAPYIFSGFDSDGGLLDYSNPATVAWIQERFRALFELGVAAIKADFGEGAPPDGVYHGAASQAMHNLYPLLYNQAVFECTEAFWGQGIIWARSAWAGSQRYPLHWSGDGTARFEDLPCVLRSALSFGLSGFPFYSHDIGGFTGLPTPELYVRWAQFGLFSSHARCHGEPPREPWAYGAEAETIFRQYCELRYRLLPYIYSEALACGQHSLPLVRALVLEFQDDPTTHTIADQYLFGNSLLVAPILDETNQRMVYLPHGVWVDYWSKAVLEGGRWLAVTAPLERLPLYVRSGAIIPYGPVMQHVDARVCDPLLIEIYAPASEGSFTIAGVGAATVEVRYAQSGGALQVAVSAAPGQVDIALYGVQVTRATIDGTPLPISSTATGGVRVSFPGTTSHTVIFE